MTDFGLIFHWGLYSVPGFDCPVSAARRRTQNGSEWYLKRLHEKGTFRPISGWTETQLYHEEEYGVEADYYSFASSFGSKDWDPFVWMDFAVELGATYVVLTVKHHDGFCLWDAERDYVELFAQAAREKGLRVGLYYSWMEFGKGCTIKYMQEVVKPHFHRLLSYKPDLLWFDGHWDLKTKAATTILQELLAEGKKQLPALEYNDRVPATLLEEASYRVYEDRAIPLVAPPNPWEHINTIGMSWGYNKEQEVQHYKTGKQLHTLRGKIKELGGRFLINLGPMADGELDVYEVNALRDMATMAAIQ